MKKFELTELEQRVLKASVDRTFFPLTATDEECTALVSVIEKAENLMKELDAYDELGDSLMEWFLKKYNEQTE